jgi:hypothetical protein
MKYWTAQLNDKEITAARDHVGQLFRLGLVQGDPIINAVINELMDMERVDDAKLGGDIGSRLCPRPTECFTRGHLPADYDFEHDKALKQEETARRDKVHVDTRKVLRLMETMGYVEWDDLVPLLWGIMRYATYMHDMALDPHVCRIDYDPVDYASVGPGVQSINSGRYECSLSFGDCYSEVDQRDAERTAAGVDDTLVEEQ